MAFENEPEEETGINPLPDDVDAWLSSGYGARTAPTAGASSFHRGNDIAAPEGTPVGAYKSGTVSYAGWDNSGGGNIVILDHPDGTQSLYMHLKDGSFAVKPGDQVAQGQQIAAVGSTGASTGPHLHFSIKENGEYVDPAGYYPGY